MQEDISGINFQGRSDDRKLRMIILDVIWRTTITLRKENSKGIVNYGLRFLEYLLMGLKKRGTNEKRKRQSVRYKVEETQHYTRYEGEFKVAHHLFTMKTQHSTRLRQLSKIGKIHFLLPISLRLPPFIKLYFLSMLYFHPECFLATCILHF